LDAFAFVESERERAVDNASLALSSMRV